MKKYFYAVLFSILLTSLTGCYVSFGFGYPHSYYRSYPYGYYYR
jgi:hypothetical protein